MSGRRQFQVMVLVTVMMMTAFSIALAVNDLDTLKTKLQALERTAAGTSDEEKLLKDIGALAQQLKTMPLPKEVRRHMARGEAYVEIAKDKEGFKLAAKEFEAAAKAAPWLASAYYNLGVVQDKAGLYGEAMRSLKIYLAIAPEAQDAAAIEKLIFKIEVRKEGTANKAKQVEQAKSLKKRESDIAGVWWNKAWRNPPGEWYEEKYEEERSTYYDIVKTKNGSYLASPFIRKPNYYPIPETFILKLEGKTLTGTVTIDYKRTFRNAKVFKHSVRGTLSEDGNTMTLEYLSVTAAGSHGDMADGWRDLEKEARWIRKR
jgi:tetratricopeptide (TPR) repeat protein